MSSLILFLLLSQTAPPQDYIGKVPNFPPHQHRVYPDGQKILKGQQYADLFAESTCFAIRSYVFTRQDGNAPVLVGSSTCTPASALRMERSKHRQGRLVLLDAPAGDE